MTGLAMLLHHLLARPVQQAYPVSDKAALSRFCVRQFLCQRRVAAATQTMAHYYDFFDFQDLHCKFQRGGHPVPPRLGFKRGNERGDIADHEYLAGAGIENLSRVHAAVGTGDDHHLGALAFSKLLPTCAFRLPPVGPKPAIAFDHFCESVHADSINTIGSGLASRLISRYLQRMTQAINKSDMPVEARRARKPDWIRVKAPTSTGYSETRRLMRELDLHTVCEEAACPNIGECWTKKHATVMILGDVCTRACAFCNVKTGMPRAVDAKEPEHVAEAAARMGLKHIVITSVDRDDLPDGGADQFVKVINALRSMTPDTTIEILTPDFRNKTEQAVEKIVQARPDVYNHNLETVPRLYPTIRPGARYYASIRLLEQVKRHDPTIFTKSGIMLGLGEERLEIHQVMDDMRSAEIDFLTMGQYLQPTPKHAKVIDFVTPQTFTALAAIARAKGFLVVASSPLTRSSYHADEDFKSLKAAREAKLAKAG